MLTKHCLIKAKEEFTIKLAQIKTTLMVFHKKICSKIITPTVDLILVEGEIKTWEDFNQSSKIFLVNLLLNKGLNREENPKTKEKT